MTSEQADKIIKDHFQKRPIRHISEFDTSTMYGGNYWVKDLNLGKDYKKNIVLNLGREILEISTRKK